MQVLKKAQRDCGAAIRNSSSTMSNDALSDLETAWRNFVSGMVHKEPGICEVRQQYTTMDSFQVIDQVSKGT